MYMKVKSKKFRKFLSVIVAVALVTAIFGTVTPTASAEEVGSKTFATSSYNSYKSMANYGKSSPDKGHNSKSSKTVSIQNVKSITDTKLEVKLTGKVDSVKISNFTIKGITIKSATLDADGKTVTLEATGLHYDKKYTLTISGLFVNGKAQKKLTYSFVFKKANPPGKKNFTLSIMHTNDTHANLDNVAKRVTAVKEVRANKPGALLLDAGDVFSGTLYFNEFKGQADLQFMNLMKYDLMTMGNHEFDLGSGSEGHKALADFVKGSNFAFVSTNVNYNDDPNLKGLYSNKITNKPKSGSIYRGVVKKINGQKVGFFGLTTEETKDISSPENVTFSNYIEEAKKAVAAFEKQGINKIVAITHIGYDDNPAYDNDLTLAKEVNGIDVIVGGHSHTQLNEPVLVVEDENGKEKDPTVIVQAYQYNEYLGTLDVEFDKKGKVVDQAGELIRIADKTADPEAEALLKPYKDKIDLVKNTATDGIAVKALTSPRDGGDVTKPSVRKNETELGNLITDAMLDKAKEFNSSTVMAFQNGGGIRADINEGPITLGEILTVLPFGNTLATMELTGAEIKEALEHSVRLVPSENGGFLHVAGMRFTFDSTKVAGDRVETMEVKQSDGSYVPIELTTKYTVATNAFTAKGGDGFTVFQKAYNEGRVTDLGLADWENLRDYVNKIKDINPQIESRITDSKGTFSLSLMHTNDTHANLDNVAKRVTAVKEIREQKPSALLVDAGDVFSGTLYFNEFKGMADLTFMNLMKYDVMTLGNHEFDLGNSEGHKELAAFIKAAQFPIVSTNVDFSEDNTLQPLFTDSIVDKPNDGEIYKGIIKEVDGEKVGFFGLTTEDTKDIANPGKVKFENYIEKAEDAVEAFEAIGVNKIVAVTHIGYDDNPAVDNDLTLATEVDGIDVIVGGHSHTQLNEPVVITKDENGAEKDPTIIVQAYQYNEYLGTLDVEFDQDGKVIDQEGKLIKIADKTANPEAAALLQPYADQIATVKNTPTGATAVKALENPRSVDKSVRKNETELGNLITDAMLDKAKEFNPNTVIAFQNGGGIRASIDQGEITVGEVLTVLPFGNTLATMTLTGAEIKEALEHSVGSYPNENGGFLHVSGMRFTFDSSLEKGNRVQTMEVLEEDGSYTSIDAPTQYVVATNAFTAKGGDGFTVFKNAYDEGRVIDLGLADWENLRDYIKKLVNVDPEIEGRIKNVAMTTVLATDFSGTESSIKVHNGNILVDVSGAESLENAVIKGNLKFVGAASDTFSISNVKVEGDFDISELGGSNFFFTDIEVDGETIF